MVHSRVDERNYMSYMHKLQPTDEALRVHEDHERGIHR